MIKLILIDLFTGKEFSTNFNLRKDLKLFTNTFNKRTAETTVYAFDTNEILFKEVGKFTDDEIKDIINEGWALKTLETKRDIKAYEERKINKFLNNF